MIRSASLFKNTDATDRQKENTKRFLNLIALHLSGRSECKGVEYHCMICDNYVSFKPYVEVFRSKHNRTTADKVSVDRHVLFEHMNELLKDSEGLGNVVLLESKCMVRGHYVYRCSVGRKRRRWERVISTSFPKG